MSFASPASPAAPIRGRYRNPTVRPAWYRSRQRMITPAQRRAERAYWPALGLRWSHDERLDLDNAFGRCAPTVLEIGCGTGEALAAMAAARPSNNFIGIDWYRGGVASSLQRLAAANLTNARLIRGDASTLLSFALPRVPLFDEVTSATACPLPSSSPVRPPAHPPAHLPTHRPRSSSRPYHLVTTRRCSSFFQILGVDPRTGGSYVPT